MTAVMSLKALTAVCSPSLIIVGDGRPSVGVRSSTRDRRDSNLRKPLWLAVAENLLVSSSGAKTRGWSFKLSANSKPSGKCLPNVLIMAANSSTLPLSGESGGRP